MPCNYGMMLINSKVALDIDARYQVLETIAKVVII